jgi:hypothetical protein
MANADWNRIQKLYLNTCTSFNRRVCSTYWYIPVREWNTFHKAPFGVHSYIRGVWGSSSWDLMRLSETYRLLGLPAVSTVCVCVCVCVFLYSKQGPNIRNSNIPKYSGKTAALTPRYQTAHEVFFSSQSSGRLWGPPSLLRLTGMFPEGTKRPRREG